MLAGQRLIRCKSINLKSSSILGKPLRIEWIWPMISPVIFTQVVSAQCPQRWCRTRSPIMISLSWCLAIFDKKIKNMLPIRWVFSEPGERKSKERKHMSQSQYSEKITIHNVTILRQNPFQCPKCLNLSARELLDTPNSGLASEETLEGQPDVTIAQCQNPECLHEFTVVSHRAILQSIRGWTSNQPSRSGSSGDHG